MTPPGRVCSTHAYGTSATPTATCTRSKGAPSGSSRGAVRHDEARCVARAREVLPGGLRDDRIDVDGRDVGRSHPVRQQRRRPPGPGADLEDPVEVLRRELIEELRDRARSGARTRGLTRRADIGRPVAALGDDRGVGVHRVPPPSRIRRPVDQVAMTGVVRMCPRPVRYEQVPRHLMECLPPHRTTQIAVSGQPVTQPLDGGKCVVGPGDLSSSHAEMVTDSGGTRAMACRWRSGGGRSRVPASGRRGGSARFGSGGRSPGARRR